VVRKEDDGGEHIYRLNAKGGQAIVARETVFESLATVEEMEVGSSSACV